MFYHPTNYPTKISQIPSPELQAFLHVMNFGSMETNAMPLTNQEEEHLFDLLDRLHRWEGRVDVKGVWPVLAMSSGFRGRSGLVLMSMYYGSNVVKEEFFKKTFMKDLQTLQNKNYTPHNLSQLLQALNLPQTHFLQQYHKQHHNMVLAKNLLHPSEPIRHTQTILGDRMLEENQYDSQPDQEELRWKQAEEELQRNLSVVVKKGGFFTEQDEEDDEEREETISIVGRRRKISPEICQRRTQKKRKPKPCRPDPANKKKKLKAQYNNNQILANSFIKDRRQKSRLKQAYKFLLQQYQSEEQVVQEIQPPSPGRRRRQPRRSQQMGPGRKKNNPIEGDQQYERRNEQNSFQSEGSQQQSQEAQMRRGFGKKRKDKPCQMQQMLEQQQQNTIYRRLTKPCLQECSSNSNQPQLQSQSQSQQLHNESLANLHIKFINFPTSSSDYSMLQQKYQQQFNVSQFVGWLEASCGDGSLREKLTVVRDLVKQKDKVGLENVLCVFMMLRLDLVGEHRQTYLRPMLEYKLTHILAEIVNEIFNILYTESSCVDFSSLYDKCKVLIVLNEKSASLQDESEKGYPFSSYVWMTFKDICEDFENKLNNKIAMTASKINFASPVEILKTKIRIKLPQVEFQQTLLIALLIIHHGLLSKLSKQHTSSKQVNPVYKILKDRIKNNYNLLNHLGEFYRIYDIGVYSKEELYELLGFAGSIDCDGMKNDGEREIVVSFVSAMIHNFITQKLKQNTSHKSILSYLIRNPFLQQCQKTTLFPHGSQITLKKYQILLQFQRFHEDITIKTIIQFVQKVDFTGNCEESMFMAVLGLLAKCYQIKRNSSSSLGMGGNAHRENLLQNIRSNVSRILKTICQKYISYDRTLQASTNNSQPCQSKKEKYSHIMDTFLQHFTTPELLLDEQDHFIYILKLMVSFVWPLLSQAKKQDGFIQALSDTFLRVVYSCEDICHKLAEQYQRKNPPPPDDDMQQAYEYILTKKQQVAVMTNSFLSGIINMLAQVNVVQSVGKECLGFTAMRSYRQNVYYEIHGVATILSLFANGSLNQLKQGILRNLPLHSKEVKIQLSVRPYKSTNKLVLEYVKGMVRAMSIFVPVVGKGGIFEQFLRDCVGVVMDVLMIGLASEREGVAVGELVGGLCRILQSTNIKAEHMLVKYPIPKLQPSAINNKTDLQLYLSSILSSPNRPQQSTLHKLGNLLLPVLISLHKDYSTKWKNMQNYIGLNLLNIFIFLLEIEAPESIVKEYRPYFVINGGNMMGFEHNVLLGLEIEGLGAYRVYDTVIRLFRIVEQKKIASLAQTIAQYFKHTTTGQLKQLQTSLSTPNARTQESPTLPRTRFLIQALYTSSRTITTDPYRSRIDAASLKLCESLVGGIMGGIGVLELGQDAVVEFLFTTMKEFPQFGEVWLGVIKMHSDRLDRILKSRKKRTLISCHSLEQAMNRYLLCNSSPSPFIDYEQLYSILWSRVQKIRGDTDGLEQLRKIISKCIGIVGQIDQGLAERFNTLLINLEQSREKMSTFEWIMHRQTQQ